MRQAVNITLLLAAARSAQAQGAPPRAYSFTQTNSLVVPDLTVSGWRDGAREVLDESRPSSSDTPGGFHARVLYDFAAHKLYAWDPRTPSQPCGVQDLTDAAVPPTHDIVTGTDQLLQPMRNAPATSVGNEAVNGIPARHVRYAAPAGGGTADVWLATSGGYVVRFTTTQPGAGTAAARHGEL